MKGVFWAVLVLAFAGVAAADTPDASAPPAPVLLSSVTQGYTYFNRPGAQTADLQRDLRQCVAQASQTFNFTEQSAGSGILLQAEARYFSNRGIPPNVENCMVITGWRVVLLSPDEGMALAAQPPAAIVAQLTPWIGADVPHGQIVRAYRNEALASTTRRFSAAAARTRLPSLALAFLAGDAPSQVSGPTTGRPDGARFAHVLRDNQLATAPPGSAIIVVGLQGMSFHDGIGLGFQRVTELSVSGLAADGQPDLIDFHVALMGARSGANYRAYAVAPGRWRLSSYGLAPTLNFCLGSPATDVLAGEVVYLGTYDLAAEDLTPTMSLYGPRQFMHLWPEGATRLRPATYVNGVTGPCTNDYIYAVEFRDAPFEPGYELGSRAQPLTRLDPAS